MAFRADHEGNKPMRKVLNWFDRKARDLRAELKMQSKTTEGFPTTGAKWTGHRK